MQSILILLQRKVAASFIGADAAQEGVGAGAAQGSVGSGAAQAGVGSGAAQGGNWPEVEKELTRLYNCNGRVRTSPQWLKWVIISCNSFTSLK